MVIVHRRPGIEDGSDIPPRSKQCAGEWGATCISDNIYFTWNFPSFNYRKQLLSDQLGCKFKCTRHRENMNLNASFLEKSSQVQTRGRIRYQNLRYYSSAYRNGTKGKKKCRFLMVLLRCEITPWVCGCLPALPRASTSLLFLSYLSVSGYCDDLENQLLPG